MMARGIFSGFFCGACMGVATLAVWSQMVPLNAGPAPMVRTESPAHGFAPNAGRVPDMPVPDATGPDLRQPDLPTQPVRP